MSQFPTSTIRLQTLALLRDQIIASALMDGSSLDEFILSTLLKSPPQQSSGRVASAAALTGRMRSDAGMMRAASRNMDEASSIAAIAQKGAASVKDALSRMQGLAEGVADGSLTAQEAQTTYMNLAASINGTTQSIAYNGINLLDSTNWGNDERLDYDAANGTASLSIQAGNSPTAFILRDLDLGAFAATELADASTAAATATRLSGLVSNVGTIASGYESMAARYASESKGFTHQSTVLETAAARAMDEDGSGIKTLLLDFLLKSSGRIVDSAS